MIATTLPGMARHGGAVRTGARAWVLIAVVLGALLGLPGEAGAGGPLDDAAGALRHDEVYVHPTVRSSVSRAEGSALRRRVRSGRRVIYVAVLPSAPGTAPAGAEALSSRLGLLGTVAVVEGDDLVLSATSRGDLSPGALADVVRGVRAARDASGGASTAASLLDDFVRRVQATPRTPLGSG